MIDIDKKPIEVDVLVAGGGIGGLMAAISAADQKASVVIAEKANTKRSGSGSTGNDHFTCYIPEVHGKDIQPIVKELMNSLLATIKIYPSPPASSNNPLTGSKIGTAGEST